ncbi:C40 family peptidase [Agrococcus jejuensis]|uniref:Cell wall-associated hydrolase, NlpC family n=1 Tax=Agrococcus jejuensis TaxID=399736 RepID=A0A1G8BA78_9MICO|nr:C40 family peptidase [Agrococcus jejuensis]SDH29933.1 Cell wall-associated hydrolase, NlpC family [Agrococcus jejuensis]
MQHSTTSTEIVAQPTPRTTIGARRSMAKRVGVAAVAVALFGTVALPAAALQTAQAQPAVLDGSIAELLAQTQQQVEVQQSPLVDAIAENGLAATTPEELAQAQAEAAAAEAERQEAAAAAAATTATAAAPAAASSSSVPSAASGSIVGIAQSQLGVPYVWGGASPSEGFDCSGFTQWVYGQVGVYLPHSDRGQLGYGTPVAVSAIQPGDLVIWNGHTAIYVGNDSIIHAATAGKPVKYSSFSAMVAAMGTPQVRRF